MLSKKKLMSTNAHDTDPTGWTLDQWDTCNIYILLYTFVNISVKKYWMLFFLPGSLLDSTDFVIQRNHLILWKRLKFQMPSKHSFVVHNEVSNTCYWPKLCLLYEANFIYCRWLESCNNNSIKKFQMECSRKLNGVALLVAG